MVDDLLCFTWLLIWNISPLQGDLQTVEQLLSQGADPNSDPTVGTFLALRIDFRTRTTSSVVRLMTHVIYSCTGKMPCGKPFHTGSTTQMHSATMMRLNWPQDPEVFVLSEKGLDLNY